jgi:hypothetical protein
MYARLLFVVVGVFGAFSGAFGVVSLNFHNCVFWELRLGMARGGGYTLGSHE